MASIEQPSIRIGELAKRSGLSVRTLHFYDEIGLLSPSNRTGSGYRIYGHAEIIRLQKITSLRALGLSLDRIKEFLNQDGSSAKQVLQMQITDLDERAKEMLDLRDRLGTIVRRLDNDTPPIDVVLRTIQEINSISKYFTQNQIEELDARGKAIGLDRIEKGQMEWKELLAEFESALKHGDDPTCDAVQELAQKAIGLVTEFSGGDAAIERAVHSRYRGEGASNIMKQHGWDIDQTVIDYMNKAMQACRSNNADCVGEDE